MPPPTPSPRPGTGVERSPWDSMYRLFQTETLPYSGTLPSPYAIPRVASDSANPSPSAGTPQPTAEEDNETGTPVCPGTDDTESSALSSKESPKPSEDPPPWIAELEAATLAAPRPLSRLHVLKTDVIIPFCSLLLYFIPYALYAFVVGLIFVAIEGSATEDQLTAAYEAFVAQNFTANQSAVLTTRYGLGIPYNESQSKQWNMLSGMYYTITFSSTIGYGDFVPITTAGQALTFLFALTGLPFYGTLLVLAGRVLVGILVGALVFLTSFILTFRPVLGKRKHQVQELAVSVRSSSRRYSLKDVHEILTLWSDGEKVEWIDACEVFEDADRLGVGLLLPEDFLAGLQSWAKRTTEREISNNDIVLIFIMVVIIAWLAIGALIFSAFEGYNWETGFWFCFVTLTTIGYGDYTATTTGSRIFWLWFVYYGVGLMAWLLSAVCDRLMLLKQHINQSAVRFSYQYDLVGRPRIYTHCSLCLLPLLVPLGVVLGYAAGGALMFTAIEGPSSAQQVQSDTDLWNKTNAFAFTVPQQQYLQGVIGIPRAWNFANAFVFSMVSITTVGYGVAVPLTAGGEALLMIFAVIGIGLIAYSLGNVAEFFLNRVVWVWSRLTWLLGHERHLVRNEFFQKQAQLLFQEITTVDHPTVEEASELIHRTLGKLHVPKLRETLVKFDDGDGILDPTELMTFLALFLTQRRREMVLTNFAVVSVILVVVTFSFATVYMALEGWSYTSSLYFCFITLATIGFGDFSPTTYGSAYFNVFSVVVNMGFMIVQLGMARSVARAIYIPLRNWWCRRRKSKKTGNGD